MNRYIKLFVYFLSFFLPIFSPNKSVYAQPSSGSLPIFVSPFDFPLLLSGNFGELRSNHFHGGLDFKTNGTVGKPVRALADGHISNIRVTHGSGYVLEVTYDGGYRTINRHLKEFVGEVASRVKSKQYDSESWEVEIKPEPGEYPVKAGQVIARSGNTGYSFGPHLHLDVLETATGDHIDPILAFKHSIKDTTPPRVEGMALFPQPGKGVVNGQQEVQTFSPHRKERITAWGWIGAGICAYDHMEGANNRYGVHTVILEVDGKEVFRSVVNRFSPEETRMINSWTHGQYMKSFIDPGNTLRMLHAGNDFRGLVEITEERPYRLDYTLIDAFGNSSKASFTVWGKRADILPFQHREKYTLRWNKVNYLHEPGMSLVIPRGMLYDDVYLNYELRADSGDIAFTYRLHDKPVPLHARCELKIGLRRQPVKDVSKYYVAGINTRGKKYALGGSYEDGFMKTAVRELGTFTVAVDTIPPVITPLNPKQWSKNRRIVYKVKDEESGIDTYHGTIDGKYALFGIPNSIAGHLVYEIDPERVSPGKHQLEITVTDACGNVAVKRTEFIW